MAAQSYRIHYCRPDSRNSIGRTLEIDTIHFRVDISLKTDENRFKISYER